MSLSVPPIFDCESDYVSFLGDKKFNITCQVKAEPTLTGSSVTWYTGIYKNFSRSVTDKNYNNGQYVYWQKKVSDLKLSVMRSLFLCDLDPHFHDQ